MATIHGKHVTGNRSVRAEEEIMTNAQEKLRQEIRAERLAEKNHITTTTITGALRYIIKDYRDDGNEAMLVRRLRFLTKLPTTGSARVECGEIAVTLNDYLYDGRNDAALLESLEALIEYERSVGA